MPPGTSIRSSILLLILILCGCFATRSLQELSGPYLGQKPPGNTPEIFAPGIVSTAYDEFKIVFSPDGRELHYQLWGAPHPVIVSMMEIDGIWTGPEVASFSGRIIEAYCLSPDGGTMVICSSEPVNGKREPSEQFRLRIVRRNDGAWGAHEPLNETIHGYPAMGANGNLYPATGDIWISELVDGEYTAMRKLGDAINTEQYFEEDPFIAPDESYLIFCRRGNGFGSWDMFISFRRDDGSWTTAVNMGEPVNSSASEVYPFVSSDGRYLFYGSTRSTHPEFSREPITCRKKTEILDGPGNGRADIYWIDAAVIEALRPRER